jgi:formylglycine-generating enzyme required for sulfatase activity/cephalosporin-C deacetylase-like acetyl esterase
VEGQTVSHYLVLERLGGGGMGVVYKAQDTRLKRLVALKFLPPDLTRDDDARQRFMQEAQAASALDHPNICTIHEIDTTPDGQIFLAMAYYEGETLKKRIERGLFTPAEAVGVAIQVAQGLVQAHAAGIVHRDIKPANLMATKDGTIKIVDFGIAKLSGATELTRTGVVTGTVAHMAPEQLRGGMVDHRVDIWALGVVLYQMVTGRLPFRADHESALIHAILNDSPQNVTDLQPDTPAEFQHIVARALQKDLKARYATAAELRDELLKLHAALMAPAVPKRQSLRRPQVLVPIAIALLVAAVGGVWTWRRGADARWARGEAIPQVKALIQQNQVRAAFELAERAERSMLQDGELAALWPQMSAPASFETAPVDADIEVRDYFDPGSEWKLLGHSPIRSQRLPFGVYRVRARAPGYDLLETVEWQQAAFAIAAQFQLQPSGAVPQGMVALPAGPLDLGFVVLRGAYEPVAAPAYFIDRFEVTNEAFKSFVDRGGYQSEGAWKHPFVDGGRSLAWKAAMARFTDATGRPGPSTWSVGTYPDGQARFPVGGVSWYEAAAYCESIGKSLPTIYHWGQAASVNWSQLIVPMSNFNTKGAVAVGTTEGLSRSGAFEMAGNVKEWVWNASGDDRYLLGGAWNDPEYKFYEPEARASFDRTASNGFRCAQYGDASLPEALTRNIPLPRRDYSKEQPASDQVFEAYKSLYLYDKTDLQAKVESVDDKSEHWRKEKVTFQAAYGGERAIAYLFLPKSGAPPYQTIVYFPGAFGFQRPSSDVLEPEESFWEFLPTSGRAIMFPIYAGTYERNRGEITTGYAKADRVYRNYMIKWVQDFMRSVDYLETRSDIDARKLAYLGASWGGQAGAIIPAIDSRITTAVLMLAGLPMQHALPEADPVNFVRHVKVPVLMMGGQYDFVFPLEASQRPLYNQLGTPVADKRHVVFEGMGHEIARNRTAVIREVLPWLDKYLGPVK